MATRNVIRSLPDALDGLRNQDFRSFEVVVADGASSDGTVALLRVSSDVVTTWDSQPDNTVYEAWNRALARCRGKWLLFHGADDVLDSASALQRVAARLERLGPDVGIAYGSVLVENPSGHVVKPLGEPWPAARTRLHKGMPIPHPGTFHRASLFTEFGNFDPRFVIAGDYEFLLRVEKQTALEFLDVGTVIRMRTGGLSTRKETTSLMKAEVVLAQQRHGISGRPPRLPLPFELARRYLTIRIEGGSRLRAIKRALAAPIRDLVDTEERDG